MNMKIIKTCSVLLAVLLLAACSSEETTDGVWARLGLNVSIGTPTRAVYEMTQATLNNATAFPDGTTIGLSVSDADGTVYTTSNTPYTLNGTVWEGQDIWLNGTPAMVSVYHPYSATANPKAIPVDCTAGVDYLYVPYDANRTVDNYRPWANLEMHHAMSVFRLSLVSNIGTAIISTVELSGEGIRKSGFLDTTTGVMTFPTSTATDLLRASDLDINISHDRNHPTTIDFFVLPTGVDNSNLIINIAINGKSYTATVNNRPFSQGKIYQFPLEVGEGRLLTVSSIVAMEWREGTINPNNEPFDVVADTD